MTETVTAGTPIPLVSGWKDGVLPALWCEICDEAWPLPIEDDKTASESRRVMAIGIDHLEQIHNRKPPYYGD